MKLVHIVIFWFGAFAMIIGAGIFWKKDTAGIQADIQEQSSWKLVLVNKTHEIPQGYTVTLQQLSNNQAVDKRIYSKLQELFDAARAQEIFPEISSSYRTNEEQVEIMEDKVIEFQQQGYSHTQAKAEAEKWVATPGTSEHELGLAVDINADPNLSTDKQVYNWLAEHAYQYGFILRYPSNKVHITGVDYEPWHYRYVGQKAAKEIYEAGISLEEYLGK